MRKLFGVLFLISFICFNTSAQFGYKKKADIEKVKDSRLVVVLYGDSAYAASIKYAVEKYWNFNGSFIFAADTALKPYSKGEYSFLVFSKGKGSKIKAKVGTSELDMNGLQVINKYKRRSTKEEVVAVSFCGNRIDTSDWLPELIRGVQLLNNYFNMAVEASGDREIHEDYLEKNYPSDKSLMSGKKLLVEPRMVMLKGKEDAATLLDGEMEEVDRDDIYKAIINQDPTVFYYYFSFGEKVCRKIFLSAENSQLMYYSQESAADKCQCSSKELKAIKMLKDKAGQ